MRDFDIVLMQTHSSALIKSAVGIYYLFNRLKQCRILHGAVIWTLWCLMLLHSLNPMNLGIVILEYAPMASIH